MTATIPVPAWYQGTLAGFDLETTGPDPETARIVTASIVVRGANHTPGDYAWLVNPGIDIPEGATAVHGITTEKARTDGIDPDRAVAEIADTLRSLAHAGVPVVVYNAPYDFTVLDRETRRHGLPPFGDFIVAGVMTVVDPLVLDKQIDPYRRGKRTLTATAEHYQVRLDDAHEATADALGAMRIAWRMAHLHPHIAAMGPAEFQSFQAHAKATQAASFEDYLRRSGKPDQIDGSWPYRPYSETEP